MYCRVLVGVGSFLGIGGENDVEMVKMQVSKLMKGTKDAIVT